MNSKVPNNYDQFFDNLLDNVKSSLCYVVDYEHYRTRKKSTTLDVFTLDDGYNS